MRYWIVIIILLLSACTTKSPEISSATADENAPYVYPIQDGPPVKPLPIFFKKVTPVNEPMSRYGNPDVYKVGGKVYKVLRTASGYKARGLASWYGTKFHHQRTSSGEAYDMYGLTAAHKTLPLPSYVRVKNLANGRELIVKVNDRGPFHANRIIDLSYAAAVKLGLLPKGTALVEIEALTVNEKGKKHIAHYYLQAGAFTSEALAKSLRQKVSHLTPSTAFIEKYRGRYIVKVGPFATKAMTYRLKQQLMKQGVQGTFVLLQ